MATLKFVDAERANPLDEALRLYDDADGRDLAKRKASDLDRLIGAVRTKYATGDGSAVETCAIRAAERGPADAEGYLREMKRILDHHALSAKCDAERGKKDTTVTSSDAPNLYRSLFDVEERAILTSTSSDALATQKYWPEFSSYLANSSAALQSGVRVIDIDATSVKIPAGTALATGAWLAEGGTATASDPGVKALTVTPARLTIYSEVSREALEDNGLVLDSITRGMFSSLGELLDSAIFEGTGASNEPQGMLDLAGSSTAVSAGTAVDLQFFLDAYETSLSANAPVQAWATNPAGWGEYADLKIGGTTSYDLRPLLQRSADRGGQAIAGEVLGVSTYVTGNIDSFGAGTASVYGYDPAQVWVVRRREFRMVQDPYSKAEQGIVRFIMEGRFGVAFPQPSAVQVFSIITP